jgi:hypothetical protein
MLKDGPILANCICFERNFQLYQYCFGQVLITKLPKFYATVRGRKTRLLADIRIESSHGASLARAHCGWSGTKKMKLKNPSACAGLK